MQLDIFDDHEPKDRHPYGSSPQWQRLLNYFERHRDITADEAKYRLGIARLAARIEDLERMNHQFEVETVLVPTKYGRKARVARYRYLGVRHG